MGFRVSIYHANNGKCYFRDWVKTLDNVVRARIQRKLDQVEEGNLGDTKPVGGGVHELRLHFGPGYRMYFGMDSKEIILLLTGSDKSGQEQAVKLAKALWKEHDLNKHAN